MRKDSLPSNSYSSISRMPKKFHPNQYSAKLKYLKIGFLALPLITVKA
jgi:hypothetical protein